MQIRHRRFLFWLAAIIFIIASYTIILYAQGYRFDFDSNSFVRTGAIAISANTDAHLYIDDHYVDQTSFLNHNAGKDNLLPGTYEIRIVREGYSSWRKSATVQEGLLTDFPRILLLPTDENSVVALREESSKSLALAHTLNDPTPTPTPTPSPKPPKVSPTPLVVTVDQFALQGKVLSRVDQVPPVKIADGVLGFQISPDSRRVMWYTRNEIWVLWTANTDYQPFHAEGDRELITRFSSPVVKAAWFRDSDHIVVFLGITYRILETDTRGGINIIKI